MKAFFHVALNSLLFAGCFTPRLATHAAPPSLQPLLQGKWPTWTRGNALNVKVVDSHAYVAIGYNTSGMAYGVAVSRNYAYVAVSTGLQVIDVSNPTNCVRVSGYATRATAWGVRVFDDRVYLAEGEAGMLVLPTLPNVQFTVRVDLPARALLCARVSGLVIPSQRSLPTAGFRSVTTRSVRPPSPITNLQETSL